MNRGGARWCGPWGRAGHCRRAIGAALLCGALSLGACESGTGASGGHAPRGDRVAATAQEGLDAVVRVFVPTGEPGRAIQGTGVVIESGRVVTATHVFGDRVSAMARLQGAWVEPLRGTRSSAGGGASVSGDIATDVAILTLHAGVETGRVVRVAARVPEVGESVSALLMSVDRGSDRWTIASGTLIGYSRDGQFFAVAGQSIGGDSGSPVLDGEGRLVGVVVGGPDGGAGSLGVPFEVLWRPGGGGFEMRWWDGSPLYRGAYILCSRVGTGIR